MTAISTSETDTAAVEIRRLFDADLVSETISHPRIYPMSSDDFSPEAEGFSATMVDSIYYLGAYRGDAYLGLFVMHPHNAVCYEAHTCLLPNAWGTTSIAAAKAVIEWMFGNTSCQRVITNVPDGNPLALRLAKRAGMEEFGTNKDSIQRGGVLLSQVMLGVSKGAACQQQQ